MKSTLRCDENNINVIIRRLTPDLAEEYVRFFNATPQNVNRDEMKAQLKR